MPCPICDNDAPNCDCTPEERRMHERAEELLDRVAALEAATPRWIPVAERMPEQGVRVLACWCRDGRLIDVASRHDPMLYGGYWHRANGVEMLTPSFWMPLPPPPEAT